MTRRPHALWVSTSTTTRGGIAAYVRAMRDTDLWTDWDVAHVATHRDGSVLARVGAFAVGFLDFVRRLVVRRPDVVHLHMSSSGSFVRKALLFWIATAVRIPTVVHVHGSRFDQFYDGAPAPLRFVVRATLSRATRVIALGERWRATLSRIAPSADVVVVPNAVRVGPPRSGPRTGLTVIFLGAIGERKGAFTLLEAWAALDPAPGTRLVLAGDQESERARRLIDELGISGTCEVRGWLSPTDTAALVDSADVLVLPSRNEGQPMAVLEAMAAGLCVVASPVGGIVEMVQDGRSGLLVPPDDVPALTAALRTVTTDDAVRTRLGAAARERALAEFDITVTARRLDALYRETTNRTEAHA